MPRFDDDVTICGRSDNFCVNEVTKQMRTKTNASLLCDCLPGCYAINYDTELSLTPLLARSPLLQKRNLQVSNTAILHIYYKENSFRSQKKDELVGFTDFLCKYFIKLQLFPIIIYFEFLRSSAFILRMYYLRLQFQPTPVVFWGYLWASVSSRSVSYSIS